MKAKTVSGESLHLGFQIAPMIDVVFVIMLFFMVMAGAIKAERQLTTALPGHTESALVDLPPDEITIMISEDGYVTLNEEEVASGMDGNLKRMTAMLTRIQRDAEARGAKVLVTVQTEAQVRYQRIMDVLNATSSAGMRDVTFTVGTEE